MGSPTASLYLTLSHLQKSKSRSLRIKLKVTLEALSHLNLVTFECQSQGYSERQGHSDFEGLYLVKAELSWATCNH